MLHSRLSAITALVAILMPLSVSHAFAGSGSTDGGNVTWSSDDTNVLTIPTGDAGNIIDLSGVSTSLTSFASGKFYNVNDSGNSQSFYGNSGAGRVDYAPNQGFYYLNSSGTPTLKRLPGIVLSSQTTGGGSHTVTDTMNFQTAQSYFGAVDAEYDGGTSNIASSISFYSGSTLVATLPMTSVYAAQANGYTDATLNVSFLNGATYNQIVFSDTSSSVGTSLYLLDMTDAVATIAPAQPGVAVIHASSTSLGQGHVGVGATGAISVTNSTQNTTNNPGGMVDVNSVRTSNSSGGNITTPVTGVQITGLNSANTPATITLPHDGANSGTATVSYVNDETNIGGFVGTTTQTVSTNVTAVGYNYAAPNTLSPTLNLGATRSGGATLTGSVALNNNAPTDGYSEKLDASISGLTGNLSSTTPTVSGIAPGSSSNLNFSLATGGTSGAYSQTATIGLTSNGTGIDTLGNTALTSQTINVTGSVYQTASASLPTVVAFGTTHIGGTLAGNISVQNTAAGGLVDTLVASSIGTTGGLSISNTTPLSITSAQTSDLSGSFSTANAGIQYGTVTVGLASHDSYLTDASLGSETVTVLGYVYNLAASNLTSPGAAPPIVSLGATRVGGTGLSANLQIQNTAPASTLSEGLNASPGSVAGTGFTSNDVSLDNLAAGASGNLTYRLSSTTSGAFSATTTVGLTSTGATTSGLGTTSLGSAPVTLTGSVYQLANGVVTAPVTNFGILHRGQNEALGINISNTASGALVDELLARSEGGTGGFFMTGNATVLGGESETPAMQVKANTLNIGVNSGIVTIALSSHDHELSDVSLGTQQLAFSDTVYDHADASFTQLSGDGIFIDPPSYYSLDFGQVAQGTTASSVLELANILPYTDSSQLYTDLLSGDFKIFSGSGFDISGLRNVSDLEAGGSGLNFTVDFQALATSQANYTEVLEFNGTSSDSAGSSSLSPIYLVLSEGTGGPTIAQDIKNIEIEEEAKTNVPEAPGILTMLVGLLGLGWFAHRRKHA
jgi:hypothetical protein